MSNPLCEHTMSSIILRPDSGLRGLLTRKYRAEPDIAYPLNRKASIKDIVESVGIPHTEISAILKSGKEIPFSSIPVPGDVFGLCGFVPGTDVTKPTLLRPAPLSGTAFAADINVGKLAKLLRMAGFDTWYDSGADEVECVEVAATQGRILLSRSRDLLKRENVTWGRLIREQQPARQLAEVINLYGLQGELKPFTRCLECNTLLDPVEKTQIIDRLRPLTRMYYHSFKTCPDCRRIYWKGSHYQRMVKMLRGICRLMSAEMPTHTLQL